MHAPLTPGPSRPAEGTGVVVGDFDPRNLLRMDSGAGVAVASVWLALDLDAVGPDLGFQIALLIDIEGIYVSIKSDHPELPPIWRRRRCAKHRV